MIREALFAGWTLVGAAICFAPQLARITDIDIPDTEPVVGYVADIEEKQHLNGVHLINVTIDHRDEPEDLGWSGGFHWTRMSRKSLFLNVQLTDEEFSRLVFAKDNDQHVTIKRPPLSRFNRLVSKLHCFFNSISWA